MLKVVCVVDKEGTALDRLAKGVAQYHKNIDYKVVSVHPKRPDRAQLIAFFDEILDADIIDWQYFKTAEMLFKQYPDLLEGKKHILTHNNPYSIYESDWARYDIVVGNNLTIYEKLGQITESIVEYVPLTVEGDFWKFNNDWQPNDKIIMVANRIESKKGVLPVALACKKLGVPLTLVGSISDAEYFGKIMDTGMVKFHERITDEELRKLYYESTLHICNSVDNFESGTMPILEAMMCGTPVLTRKVGHVPDLDNGENMSINLADSEDVDALAETIQDLLMDKKKMYDMRDRAWQTAKSRTFERRAFMYQKLYRQAMYPGDKPVSVVVPIYNNPAVVTKCLAAISSQTYKNIEIIVADDNPDMNSGNQLLISEFAKLVNIPVMYLKTAYASGDYGLARARNIATIEATGDIMVYCDQRMVMDHNAIEELLKYLKPRFWLYGNKDGKKDFVENFSCVYRQDVINAGMFCERIDAYGGMSQELRHRIRNQGIKTEFVASAKATPNGKSNNRYRKRQEIIHMKTRLWKMGLEA